MRTSSGPGLGMSESTTLIDGPLYTKTSFILLESKIGVVCDRLILLFKQEGGPYEAVRTRRHLVLMSNMLYGSICWLLPNATIALLQDCAKFTVNIASFSGQLTAHARDYNQDRHIASMTEQASHRHRMKLHGMLYCKGCVMSTQKYECLCNFPLCKPRP